MNLRKKAETNTKITLEWDSLPGAIGYRFQSALTEPKWSHTWDGTKTEVTFAKTSWYKVEALGVEDSGQYPSVAPPPPPPPPPPSGDWPGSFFTGPAGEKNILPARQGVLSGIWDSGFAGTDRIKTRENQVGRKFDLAAGSYSTGYNANADGKLSLIKNEGRIPVCSMHSNRTVAEINNGAEDAWHTASANAVKVLGVPTFVRLLHEFNGEWMRYYTPGDTDAAAQPFITAWRRIVGLWKAAGATNACFIWHTADSNGANARRRYPGDEWVDWIASSNYTYASVQWAGFYQDYADLWQLLGWAREYKVSMPARYETYEYKPLHDVFVKPFMLGEMGHFEDARKERWFRDAKSNLLGTFQPEKQNGGFPRVLAMLYSDYGTEADAAGQNWTIDRPASGLEGFREMVNDPYFKTR